MSSNGKRICSKVCGVHDIYCCGSHVTIDQKAVTVRTEPAVSYCPLHKSLYGTKRIDSQGVRRSVEAKIERFGFCCKCRDFSLDPIVAYGASEMMSVWLSRGSIDCAVVVCEGAGTVTAHDARLVQGIGARLTGIIKTSPIGEVIEYIEKNGGMVLSPFDATIDQVAGVNHAVKTEAERIAVSIASFQAKAISDIRRIERNERKEIIIFSVCNTLAKTADVKHIAEADIVCASASTILRNEIGPQALLQVGVTIPVFAMTERGKELVLDYLKSFKEKLVIFKTSSLPYDVKNRGPKKRATYRE